VCIRTDREKTGDYSGGSIGYRLNLYVNIISWPEGELLFAEKFQGPSPLQYILSPNLKPGDPIYGGEPIQDVKDYVLSVLD
jgi:hypothetical protein